MRAIAQMKPTISRAIAVVTTTFGLPVAARRRYRAHNRTCAFQAMSRIAADRAQGDREASADASRHPVGPGPLDQRASRKRIAGLGDAAAADGLPDECSLGTRPR